MKQTNEVSEKYETSEYQVNKTLICFKVLKRIRRTLVMTDYVTVKITISQEHGSSDLSYTKK
jgi:hypothetical protein